MPFNYKNKKNTEENEEEENEEDEQQAAKSEKELVFPHFDDGFVPSESLLSMVLGPLPEGLDIDKQLD